ncbi:MAG: amidinotransferase [Anaerolineae bacterium]|nr:amidinotransferase [Anaerolineae bacterium]
MKHTYHPLLPDVTRILARQPAPNFADGLTTATHLGKPDYDLALQQYNTYIEKLRGLNLEVTVLDADADFPDGHFVEDPVIVYGDMAFLCRSGANARRKEPQSLVSHLHGLRVIPLQDETAFIDGGDVLFCADRVLVGISERSNLAGATALHRALQTVKADIRLDCVSFSGVLHLKSGLTEIAPSVMLHDPALKTDYALDWAEVIELPSAEGYGADVMPVNDTIFISTGFPTVRQVAEKYYQNIIELNMSEFQKMDGALTCLSLRY